MPSPAGDRAAPAGTALARREAAGQLRQAFPAWVVIWVARTGRYHAYPLASTRATGGLADTEPAGLAGQIEQAQRSATAGRARPRRAGDPGQPG